MMNRIQMLVMLKVTRLIKWMKMISMLGDYDAAAVLLPQDS